MKFKVVLSAIAKKQLKEFKKSGSKKLVEKIYVLLNDLEFNPETGIGKPEQLKHKLSGYWSRRINKEHRLIYKIEEEKLIVLAISLKGNY